MHARGLNRVIVEYRKVVVFCIIIRTCLCVCVLIVLRILFVRACQSAACNVFNPHLLMTTCVASL